MSQDTDSTENDLRHRLAALEDEVQSLRNDDGAKSTRRMMLKGGVAALGLGALATPSSAGTNQAGTIGTEQNPQDVYSEDLYIYEQGSTPSAPPSGYIDIYAKTDGNFYKLQSDGTESQLGGGGLSAGEDFDGQGTSEFTNLASVSTEEAIINGRDMVSRTDETITVGTDTATLQEAVEQALLVDASVTVDLPDGNYAENVTVPTTLVNDGDNIIVISGNTTTLGNVTVDSMILGDSLGKRPFRVEGIEFTSTHPDADGPASLQAEGGVVVVQDCAFSASANRAMTCYGGTLITKGTTDVGTDNYSSAIVCKNVGDVLVSNVTSGGDFTGSTTSTTFSAQNAGYFGVDRQVSVTGSPLIKSPRSVVLEYDSNNFGMGQVPHGLAGMDGEGIEYGTVTHADPGTAAGNAWSDYNKDTQSVTFDHEFAQAPKVWVKAGPGDTARGVCGYNSVTTTGFDSEWLVHNTSVSTGTTAQWWAVGPR